MTGPTVQTERLVLRRWGPTDLGPLADMNADPVVMAYLGSLRTPQQNAEYVTTNEHSFDHRGYGMWAVEERGGAPFIGFVGLGFVGDAFPFGPAVEVAWRLAQRFWGRGLATEAAQASLTFAFDQLGLDEVVSMTVPDNRRSWMVMERIGMTRDVSDDFDHPGVPEGDPLCRHVLYRMRRARFEGQRSVLQTSAGRQEDDRHEDDRQEDDRQEDELSTN